MLKDKGLIIGIVATVLLIGGGIFFFSKSPTPQNSEGRKVSQEILVPTDTYVTGGIKDGSYLPASSSASITLVEFGDYECPACSIYSPLVKQLLTDMPGQVNLVFRNFPLTQHKRAEISAQVAEAAGLQGKFWEMHEKLYATQSEWAKASDANSLFLKYAEDMKLDMAKFKEDLNSAKVKDKISKDANDARLININATPTFFVNGTELEIGSLDYNAFKNSVLELSK